MAKQLELIIVHTIIPREREVVVALRSFYHFFFMLLLKSLIYRRKESGKSYGPSKVP